MRKAILASAAAIAVAGITPALAQVDTTTTDATAMPVEDDDDDFPWGLLGLIGLAGLLGRKRRDDVHVHRDTTNRVP